MAVTPDPQPSHGEPRLLYPAPKRSFMDSASVFWMILVAAACAGLLIWALSPNSRRVTDTADTNAGPSTRTQPVTPLTPPEPEPAARPVPAP
jgi:hypothetical protein